VEHIEEKQDFVFPLDDQMLKTIEPYIQWRENEAVKKACFEVAQKYLEKEGKNA